MYVDYRKVGNIPKNHERNVNLPYLLCFGFCGPRNGKSERSGEFYICQLPHIGGEIQGWRVQRRPIRMERTAWPFSCYTQNCCWASGSFESCIFRLCSTAQRLANGREISLDWYETKWKSISRAGFESRVMRFSGPKLPWSRNWSKLNSPPLSLSFYVR